MAIAILHAATHPKRDVFVGSASKVFSATNRRAPRINDWVAERTMVKAQQKDQPAEHRSGTLYPSGDGLRERGNNEGLIHSSLYTRASLHPWVTGAVVGAVGVAIASAVATASAADGHRRR